MIEIKSKNLQIHSLRVNLTELGRIQLWGSFSNNLWKAMEPVWTELAGSFEDSEDMIVASVDCKEFKDLCKKHKVTDYPTIKLFHEGKDVGVYRGDTTLGGFGDFLE